MIFRKIIPSSTKRLFSKSLQQNNSLEFYAEVANIPSQFEAGKAKSEKQKIEKIGKLNYQGIFACPWFPTKESDLDLIGSQLAASRQSASQSEEEKNEYNKRFYRVLLDSNKYKMGEPIPKFDYNQQENGVWNKVYSRLRDNARTYGTRELNEGFDQLEKDNIITEAKVPNLEEVN